MNITLLKLGGSLITDKQKPYTARPKTIRQAVTEIKEALAEKPDMSLVLGNGAGSFAHQSASEYGTKQGFNDMKGRYGACFVHHDAAKLNTILVEECLRQELPVFSLQPSAMFLSSNNEMTGSFFKTLDEMREKSIVPCVYGDVIIDTLQGSSIFSTDTIFKIIATHLHAQGHTVNIIHAGSYNGVTDTDGNTLDKITPETFPAIETQLKGSGATDVTGGMELKVKEMLELAKKGIESVILNGMTKGNIKKTLLGSSYGTRITCLGS